MTRNYTAGASASLNKTITEIMRFLKDEGERPTDGLRDFLREKLGDFAVKWYRRGFNRGHRETDKRCREDRIPHVPRVLRYDATREFFTGDERSVSLKSTLKRVRGAR
jgi:hypothetical protein